MRAHTALSRNLKPIVLLTGIALVLVALAGCFGDGDNGEGDPVDVGNGDDDNGTPAGPSDPDPPVVPEVFSVFADLSADRLAGWAGVDNFTFDASNSTVISGEGQILRYTIDVGDGSEAAVFDADEDPVLVHSYDEGGVYAVNLTIEGESADGNDTATHNTTLMVFVSERFIIEGEELSSMILLGDGDSWNGSFPVRVGAFAYNVTLEFEDTTAFTGSEGHVAFMGPDAEGPLEEVAFEFAAGDEEEISFNGEFNLAGSDPGEHTLEVVLETGGVAFSGTLEIFYGIDPAQME
jgi:hypothetical protein